ncbi:MAG: tetratricopeptide repeat protein [bacterium]|nr:tetratricopeptide repeat protein [bacterium]
MSLLGRFLGGDRGNAYAEGMSLLEEGRFAEAADRLRVAALGRSESAKGSLASFHFRQALVAEGRRLMREGNSRKALANLSEAVRLWENYPDLHCLYGTALLQSGQTEAALQEGLDALRLNPDYVEARLLKAVSYQKLERNKEASDCLNDLVESGRRVNHWLVDSLKKNKPYHAESLPQDLLDILGKSLSGESEKEEVSAAVSLCREGYWEKGLEVFASLVERRPRYPDYRTRLAAALFQLERTDEALSEVEAALALNENYKTAVDLKGLILADGGDLNGARFFLREADKNLSDKSRAGAHEELFGAYLRGVLALLTGHADQVSKILQGWPDLGRTFARAELLLAASDDLLMRSTTCGRRLADLADEWTSEPLYFDLLGCHHLAHGRYRDVSGVLSRWPSSHKDMPQYNYLGELLALNMDDLEGGAHVVSESSKEGISPEAWQFLVARATYQSGADEEAWQMCQSLVEAGFHSERLFRLQIAAGRGAKVSVSKDLKPRDVIPDSCLAHWVYLEVKRGNSAEGHLLVENTLKIHPECLTARWLQPEFWLGPVRAWIA